MKGSREIHPFPNTGHANCVEAAFDVEIPNKADIVVQQDSCGLHASNIMGVDYIEISADVRAASALGIVQDFGGL